MRPAVHDENCEREVLAKILTDPYFGSMDKAMEILTPDCFHTPAHREVVRKSEGPKWRKSPAPAVLFTT